MRQVLFVALVIAGLLVAGRGVWIYVKAQVAQLLLEASWRSALSGTPVRPWPWADTQPVGRLRFAGQGVIVLAGASGRTMAFGPGHVDGTALPGRAGNCVITAHRDTHFAALRTASVGDTVSLQRPDGTTIHYQVRETRVVDMSEVSLLRQDGHDRLTLITCYPFDAVIPGGRQRYAVIAEREVSFARKRG